MLEAKLGKVGSQNPPEADSKCDQFFDGLLDRFHVHFGAKLTPTWEPKPSQNGAKLIRKSTQLGALI